MIPTLNFLKDLLPGDTPYYAGSYMDRETGRFRQTVHTSLESLIDSAYAYSEQGFDTYFGLSGFSQTWHERNGKKVFRIRENVAKVKSFWLDIDVGKEKGYATQDAAKQALVDFVGNAGMPAPSVVSSGFGLHVYWPLCEAIGREEWQALADHFEALVNHYGLLVDPSRTTDASSVLRVPGTRNYRYDADVGEPVRILYRTSCVDTLEWAKYILDRFDELGLSVRKRNRGAVSAPAAPEGLAGNFKALSEPLRNPIPIVKNCQQLREAGLEIEPVWFNMMVIASFCEEGRIVAHELSKVDSARYSVSDTDSKFDYASAMRSGPTLCETFNALAPGKCSGCQYWGHIKTPLELERVADPEPVTLPAPATCSEISPDAIPAEVVPYKSKNYAVIPGKGTVWYEEQEEGAAKERRMNESEVYLMCIHVSTDGKEVLRDYVVRKVAPGKPPEDLILPVSEAIGNQALIKWMGNNGMLPLHPALNKKQEEFMSTYLAKVQNRLPEIHMRDSFGWTTLLDKKTGSQKDGFIIGESIYTEGEPPLPTNLTERCTELSRREFQTAGSLEGWKKIADMYRTLDQKEGQLFVLASLAAPFMKYGVGTATNILMSLWETGGGRGKSTLLQVCNSVWGHPRNMMLGANDTVSARFQVLASRKNIPVCMDEMTMAEDKMLAELLYDIANGREKRKSLTSGMGLAKTGSWDTVTLMTSNRSLYETMRKYSPQASAPTMRVLEFTCEFPDYSGTSFGAYIEETVNLLDEHYGHAGRALMTYCFNNPGVFNEVQAAMRAWDEDTRVNSDERFWTYGLSAFLAVGRIAVRAGLVSYDIDALDTWSRERLQHLRNTARMGENTAALLLVDFLNDNLNSTLTVLQESRPADMREPKTEGGLDMYVRRHPTAGVINVRIELDTRRVYVRARALSKWCSNNNMSMTTLLSELQNAAIYPGEGFGKKPYNLGRQVELLDHGRVETYMFDGGKLSLPEGDE